MRLTALNLVTMPTLPAGTTKMDVAKRIAITTRAEITMIFFIFSFFLVFNLGLNLSDFLSGSSRVRSDESFSLVPPLDPPDEIRQE